MLLFVQYSVRPQTVGREEVPCCSCMLYGGYKLGKSSLMWFSQVMFGAWGLFLCAVTLPVEGVSCRC